MENLTGENDNLMNIAPHNPSILLRIGMEFDSDYQAYTYYNEYARTVNFSIRKEYVNKNKIHGYVTSRKLTCYKEGERGKDKRNIVVKKPRKETRTRCLAHIIVSRQVNEKFKVILFEPNHNHPLAPQACVHLLPSQRVIKGAQPYEISLTDNSGICPKVAFEYAALQAGGRSNLGYTLTDHKNYIRTRRRRYANNLIAELRAIKAKKYEGDMTVSLNSTNLPECQSRGNCQENKAKGLKKKERTYRDRKRLKNFTKKPVKIDFYVSNNQMYASIQPSATSSVPCPPILVNYAAEDEQLHTSYSSQSAITLDTEEGILEKVHCENYNN